MALEGRCRRGLNAAMPSALQSALLFLACTATALTGLPVDPPVPYRAKLPRFTVEQFGTLASAELLVETDAYGFVTRAEVQSASRADFGAACLAAVQKWRYAPARSYGMPTPAKFIQPFRLTAGAASAKHTKPVVSPSPSTATASQE